MKRLGTLFTLALASAVPAAFGVLASACADSTETVTTTPNNDGDSGVLGDGGQPGDGDGGADARSDSAQPHATCNDEGWCQTALPDSHAWGLETLRIVDFALDGQGGVWAAATAYPLTGFPLTSHLLQYESGVWKSRFGTGVTQNEIFDGEVREIAAVANGEFLAVGNASGKGFVLHAKNDRVTVAYPQDDSTPPKPFVGLTSIAVSSSGVPFMADSNGTVYRGELGSDGEYVWVAEPTPLHQADPEHYKDGPKKVFTIGDDVGFGGVASDVPFDTYLDIRHQVGASAPTWTTSTIYTGFSVGLTSGYAASGTALWANVSSVVYSASPSGGGLAWAPIPGTTSVEPRSVWGRASNDVWAVGDVGRVFHFDGTAWRDTAQALNGAPVASDTLFAIDGRPSGEMWIGGQGTALHYEPKVTP
jgi:hypothetical protein